MIEKIYRILLNNKKNFLILFLIFFIIFFSFWIKKTFGDQITYIELVYNLNTKLSDYKSLPLGYKINFLLYTVNTSIFLSALLIILKNYVKIYFFKSKFFISINSISVIKFLFLNYKIYIFYSLIFFLTQFKFHNHIYSIIQFEINSKLYLDAKKIEFIEPKIKKNLIIIYFESLENDIENLSYINLKNPIKELKKLPGKRILNFKQSPATAISIAGIFASQCSIPLYPFISKKIENFNQKKLKCLSDVLNEFDYKQYHFMTVDKTFHNSDLFLENHHYSVYDNQKIREKFPNAKISWGNGVFDDVMLNLAKDKILQLKKSNNPFNVVIKTTDTHPPFITSTTCKKNFNKKHKNEKTYELFKNLNKSYMRLRAYNAYKCSSNLIISFLDELKEKNALDNTVIVIMGDHLAHNKYEIIDDNNNERYLYFKINTKNNNTRNLINHFDITPTILDEMGFLPENINQYGFGISLFDTNKNFNYEKHFESVTDQKVLTDFFLKKLFEDKEVKNKF